MNINSTAGGSVSGLIFAFEAMQPRFLTHAKDAKAAARQSRNQNEFKRKDAKKRRRKEEDKMMGGKMMKKRACCVCTKNFAGNAQFFEIAPQRDGAATKKKSQEF